MLILAKYWKEIVVLLLLVFVFIFIYFKGKKSAENDTFVQVPLPDSGGSDFENERIRAVSLSLFDDMDGYNYLGHNMMPYSELLTASDSFLIQVFNDFNTLYIDKNKGTLKNWIVDEKYYDNDITDALLLRFDSLNLP